MITGADPLHCFYQGCCTAQWSNLIIADANICHLYRLVSLIIVIKGLFSNVLFFCTSGIKSHLSSDLRARKARSLAARAWDEFYLGLVLLYYARPVSGRLLQAKAL